MLEYDILANAIIEQAAKDFREVQERLKAHPDSAKYQQAASEIAGFFHSEWFKELSSASGPMILKKLKEECGT